jgi:hypothetical protein
MTTPLDDYPLMLYAWEEEVLMMRSKRLHFHDWQYRLAVPMGQYYRVTDDGMEFTQFPAGRYCRKCGCLDFPSGDRVRKRATRRWGQDDMNYLQGSCMR